MKKLEPSYPIDGNINVADKMENCLSPHSQVEHIVTSNSILRYIPRKFLNVHVRT